MSTMVSQITGVSIVCTTIYLGASYKNIQAPHHWPLWGKSTCHRWFPSMGQYCGKCFHFDGVITVQWRQTLGVERHQIEMFFLHDWTFVRGIHQSPVDSLKKGAVTRALMFSLFLNKRPNRRVDGDFERPCFSLWRHCNGSFNFAKETQPTAHDFRYLRVKNCDKDLLSDKITHLAMHVRQYIRPLLWYFVAMKKIPTFCKRHFKIHFLEWFLLSWFKFPRWIEWYQFSDTLIQDSHTVYFPEEFAINQYGYRWCEVAPNTWWRHQMELTGHRGISRTKASDAELWCFLWSDGWVNNRDAGDLRRRRAQYDVIVM